ncbi:MAG: hypothetical protein MSC30_20475 [Gaiellaceae bacterium MAG52_C11]|nr:hypothetical protein [Candidatus Gaiellasilicea maunaloa]
MKRILPLLFAVFSLAGLAALPALASHESNNALTFAPVVGSASPEASGTGTINYVKGASTEPDTVWTSSFRFSGLAPATAYSVVVFSRGEICTFTSTATGTGHCENTFVSLPKLGIAQLRVGGNAGPAVLQATRQAVASGPGEIVSRGGCREPDQAGSTCAAPGRQ